MRMRKIRILLPVLLIGLMTVVGQTGYYIPSERFSSGLINDLCQDQYGYMWIATDYGLNKFDGYRFTTYLNHEQDTTTIGNNVVDYVFWTATDSCGWAPAEGWTASTTPPDSSYTTRSPETGSPASRRLHS